jgi:A/G-specific adenine glycosylase
VEQTLDRDNPRRWYNALMDYGSVLKREQINPNRRSVHYTRQSPFENSNRQVRGAILKVLVKESPLSVAGLVKRTGMDTERIESNLVRLCEEGFIRKEGRNYVI